MRVKLRWAEIFDLLKSCICHSGSTTKKPQANKTKRRSKTWAKKNLLLIGNSANLTQIIKHLHMTWHDDKINNRENMWRVRVRVSEWAHWNYIGIFNLHASSHSHKASTHIFSLFHLRFESCVSLCVDIFASLTSELNKFWQLSFHWIYSKSFRAIAAFWEINHHCFALSLALVLALVLCKHQTGFTSLFIYLFNKHSLNPASIWGVYLFCMWESICCELYYWFI